MKTNLSSMLLLLLLLSSFSVLSQAPKTLSYQARLSDSGGPLNGTYTLTFTIYDAGTGGTTLWTETNSGVSAANGNISLTLGKLTPVNLNTDKPLWMGIKIGSNAEISPRIELAGSLYSLGLALPYSAKTAAPGNVFLIEATQDGARAGEFIHSGTGGGQAALFATATGGNRAFQALNSGPAASSALFYMQNTTSFAPNVEMHSQSLGQGLQINMLNNNNASDAIKITHSGSGNAINANGPIKATKFIGDGSGLTNLPSGLSLPYATTSSLGDLLSLTSTASSGNGSQFTINNPSSLGMAVKGTTNGPGWGMYGLNTGSGRGGEFEISNASSIESALYATTNGPGFAGTFYNTYSAGGTALRAWGVGTAGVAGRFSLTNPVNNGTSIFGEQRGLGYVASLVNFNNGNTLPVLYTENRGTGPGLLINQAGESGDISVFQSGFNNVARIDKTGKGFFNGGTQTGGADVAEMFDVEGSSLQYEPGDVLVISEKTDRTVEKSTEANSTRIAGVYATKPGVILTERDIEQNLDDLVPMGVVGVIPTKVCDENGPIKRGDLLVTSAVTGHAMKAIPIEINGVKIYPTGAILGKALENFDGNRGLIKVLVNVK